MPVLKSTSLCVDVLQVMEPTAPKVSSETEQKQLGLVCTDDIAVSASELIEMIRSGEGGDVNDLVRRMLDDRHAA
ncbi:MAG: hypothetical protein CMJ35_00440 [Phycisphaerae bacterium]|nr:hypothetical protein [Phycisphaerae bacterium]MBM90068.1 hypothetical protein [Phycisphaerae bacterium]HCT44960.1 hypothetical protein [Phycisphaerales bacterium]|tara:strand:- start:35 stop:259 length:225 start_codon:yes stop_codon:yes gene_type:complete